MNCPPRCAAAGGNDLMRKILVAIDGSDCALRALAFAVRQARYAPSGALHVLTVEPPADTFTASEIYVSAEHIRKVAAERAAAILAAAAEQLKEEDVPFELEQLRGEAAATVARRAAELGCESIIMGTHGRGQLGVIVMGSVAQRVVHDATLPVTLVK
jgi:nucleotide-binding universal stress UspA family protein